MKKFFALSFLAALCATVTVHATSRSESVERIESCEAILREFMADPATAIPTEVLQRARGLVIVNQARGGFVIGIKDGYATVMVKRSDDTWSLPVLMSAAEGSLGLQLGFTRIETIYVLMDNDTPRRFFNNRFNIGVDAKAVAGPKVAEREHLNENVLSTPVLVYSKNKGLYAGVSVKGGYLTRNDEANRFLYNTEYTLPEILYSNWVQAPEVVQPLLAYVRQIAP
jgi:lipid-binding SYLF domain-containing protein